MCTCTLPLPLPLPTEILDDIDSQMDHTNQRLIKETTHVKRVTAKSSTCGESPTL